MQTTIEALMARIAALEAENERLSLDAAFGIINRTAAEAKHEKIEDGTDVLIIDIGNMHAMNHFYGMAEVDRRIRAFCDFIRHDDLVIRWGGDEIVVKLASGNIIAYAERINDLMSSLDLYAVFCTLKSSSSLLETVNRGLDRVMEVKADLDRQGLKPSRDEEYKRLDSHFVAA